ncbi:unnamed protein product [Closterium sp. NIES-65]|nr:unnamed protein product [Closterium sp. NIES-65]
MDQVITASRTSLTPCDRGILDVSPSARASARGHSREASDDRRVSKRPRTDSERDDSGSSAGDFLSNHLVPANHRAFVGRSESAGSSMDSQRSSVRVGVRTGDNERLRCSSEPATPDGARQREAVQAASQSEGEQAMPPAEAAAVVKGYATTPRGQVHYRRCGSGHPVVLLHDAGRSSAMWAPVLPLLAARGCCALAVDLPGCGETTAACRDYSMLEMGAIAVAAAINVGFAQRFDLVGHGFGASLALQMAAVFPARVRRVGLWGVMPQDERSKQLAAAVQAISAGGGDEDGGAAAAPQSVVAVAVQQMLMRSTAHHVPLHQLVEAVMEGLQSLPTRHLLAKAHAAVDHGDLLDKVQQPVLCLAGCDDPFQSVASPSSPRSAHFIPRSAMAAATLSSALRLTGAACAARISRSSALHTAAASFKQGTPAVGFSGARLRDVRRSATPAHGQTTRRHMATVATIKVGDKLPDGSLSYFDAEGALQTITIESLTKGKKVVLFAVPGAFTPTCSQKHLPGFIAKADELRAKGVDTIACVSVNDPFVMRAWGESVNAAGKVLLLADGSGVYTAALGASLDLADKGLGVRSRRYALLADDGVVTVLNLEEGGAFTNSSAEDILKAL